MSPNAARRDHAELVVLSLLEPGALYGYAISKEVASRSDNQIRLTPGVLYPILRELESEGLIASTWEEVRGERNEAGEGRKRKWYRLTPKGRKRLSRGVESHRAWRAIIDLFIPGHGGAGSPSGEADR
jgi:DNA-binding PadR family transcriptional regulator